MRNKTLDFSHIRTHTIRDKSFRLVWRKPRNTCPDPNMHDVGQCDRPTTPGKELWCWPKQDPIEILFTIVHECTHGAFPDLDEASVTALEDSTKRLVERMGIEVSFNPRKRRVRTSKTVAAKS